VQGRIECGKRREQLSAVTSKIPTLLYLVLLLILRSREEYIEGVDFALTARSEDDLFQPLPAPVLQSIILGHVCKTKPADNGCLDNAMIASRCSSFSLRIYPKCSADG
jgi:hypothetical protein